MSVATFSHNDVVVLHHFAPLDGGLELSVLRRKLAGPIQFRCISIGLDAERAKLAQHKLARYVLLDWKENANKLLGPQAITFVAELPAHDQQRFSTPPLPSDFSIMTINPGLGDIAQVLAHGEKVCILLGGTPPHVSPSNLHILPS